MMKGKKPKAKPLKPSRLEQVHEDLLGTLPPVYRETREFLDRLPSHAQGGTSIIVRNYVTYSAYEDPIGE